MILSPSHAVLESCQFIVNGKTADILGLCPYREIDWNISDQRDSLLSVGYSPQLEDLIHILHT